MRCRCGQFAMPDDAMRIEARGYSLHARHQCSWGVRTQEPPPKPPEPQLRIIKESHIPPRTDGYVSWWRKWILSARGPDF
jgi:hypothetical protein